MVRPLSLDELQRFQKVSELMNYLKRDEGLESADKIWKKAAPFFVPWTLEDVSCLFGGLSCFSSFSLLLFHDVFLFEGICGESSPLRRPTEPRSGTRFTSSEITPSE